MSNYKRKEVFDYLTRKPVTTQDIELARTRVQPLAARIEQPETDYQTEVQPDMVIPPQDVLPKNPEPVMPFAPGIPNPQFRQIELAEGGRAEFAEGTRLSFKEKQKTLKDIKKYVDKKLSKKEVVTLSELNEKFGQGQRREYLYREALGKNYDKITKLQREGVGRVSLEVKDKLYSIIDDVVKGKRPLIDLSRNNLNKELPPVSERQLSKYLNENKKYKDYNLASNVDKVQQRIAKGNEKLKDATLKNIESKLEQTTANLRRPSPKRIEEFIVRDLVRHDNQGGELFKVLPKSNTKFYDKIRILDVANDDVLTTKNIKNLVDMGDPRFKEYKETFDEIKQLKKTPYINPVTKEETNLLNALQQATGNKQPLNIDHLEGVKDNPLNKLAVSTYKANTGANIKDITEEELNILGRKKFTPEQNIERLTKFTDRRLLQEAASGFEKVKTPLETLAQKTEPSLAARMSNQLGFGPSGMIDVGEEVVEDVKGIYGKYAPKIAKGALTGLQIIGTPLASSIFYGTDVGMELKQAADEGNLTAKKAVDAFVGQGEKGLYFLLPELAKDVVTNPIANKILQLGSLGRFATPVGLGLSAVGVGKDFYDQYKEFQALPPEEKEKRIKESTYTPTEQDFQMMQEAESRASAATGGRIGYADGSDDPESDLYIPPLDKSKKTSKEGIYNTKRLGPEDSLSKYKSYSEEELLGNIEAKYPNQLQSFSLEDYLLNTMPMFEPKDVAPPKSYSPMPVEKYLKERYQIELAEGGPSDPSKRKFIKGAGIVGAVGVASKFIPDLFQAAKKTKTAVKLLPKVAGMPEWFNPLVSKIIKEGTDVPLDKTVKGSLPNPDLIKIRNLEIVSPDGKEKDIITMMEFKSGQIQIESSGGAFDDAFVLSYNPPKSVIDIAGKKVDVEGSFNVLEQRPRPVGGPEDADFELDFETFTKEDAISDIERIEKIATGKKIDPKIIEQRTAARKFVEENPYDDIVNRYGDSEIEYDRMKDAGLLDEID